MIQRLEIKYIKVESDLSKHNDSIVFILMNDNVIQKIDDVFKHKEIF